jgi:hypothetical protein
MAVRAFANFWHRACKVGTSTKNLNRALRFLCIIDCLQTKDFHIRTALKRDLLAHYAPDPETAIIEELGILHGTCRIDLAVVNGVLHGYELKSDRDTLVRLPEQVQAFAAVFDYVTLVVGERHVRHAVEIIPDWWGVRSARFGSGKLSFCDLKLSMTNPSPDPMSVVRLLWRQEALDLLREVRGTNTVRFKRREWIYAELVAGASCGYLRDAVRQRLKNRADWRSDGTRLSCGD